MMKIRSRRLRTLVRNVIREVNEYSWEHADDKNLKLDRPGMEEEDRDRVSKFLKSLGLAK